MLSKVPDLRDQHVRRRMARLQIRDAPLQRLECAAERACRLKACNARRFEVSERGNRRYSEALRGPREALRGHERHLL